MVDIHAHILPQIDDGSSSMDETLSMADLAVSSGVTMMAATPHCGQFDLFENYESEELKKRYEDVVLSLKKEKIPLQLVRGMEIYSSKDITDRIKNGDVISLNESAYYLIEFPFDAHPAYMEIVLRDMLDLGIFPVIAHPERYYCVQEDPNLLYEWRKMGVLAQMNKGSLFGRFGRHSARAAEVLLKHRMISCIASDAHGAKRRTTEMKQIKRFLDNHFVDETSRILLHENPKCILKNYKLPPVLPPIPVVKRRWFS